MSLVAGRRWPGLPFPLAIVGIGGAVIAAIGALITVLINGKQSYYLGGWAPPIGIEYVVDHVSAFVSLVVTSVALVIVLATRQIAARDFADRLGTYYSMVLLLLTGLTGIVITGDLFNLFVFLEIASLAAYTLIFLGSRRGMIAGFRYLILGTMGGAFYLLGVGFIYFSTGSLNMTDVSQILPQLPNSTTVMAAAILIFVGLGLKMGLFPLHLWLPDAYTYSLSSVNSIIAPIMTKVAAYAMLRMFLSVFSVDYLYFEGIPLAGTLVFVGLAGTIFGSIAAIRQTDFRRMLAYSSISQISLIGVGIGLASPLAFAAALLHVMNHAVMKGCLFLVAASTQRETGRTDIEQFNGLGRRMPITMAAFTLASLSMIGIPPTAGFFSKWYLVQTSIDAAQWGVVAIILLSSLLTAVYLFKVLERAYLTPPKPDPREKMDDQGRQTIFGESPPSLLIGTVLLSLAVIILGIFNAPIVTHVLYPGVT